ncbi:MAG: adenine methyltransferase, partial [Rhizobiales bacterium]|nr:adenine methyltransferase [Hyphomicrobiales bacterium]
MTLGSHQRTIGASQVHITPRRILDPLGAFDLDPCASDPRPWDCAARNLTVVDDGLTAEWDGRVWLNPPFDVRQIGQWFERMKKHGRGTALVHARTETKWFRLVWDNAHALLFLFGRVVFHKPDGSPQTTRGGIVANSGAPV